MSEIIPLVYPRVSVVLPVFNAAAHLSEALESILTQNFTDFELLAVYDDSSDESLAILQAAAVRDARVRIIHGPGERLTGALNLGLQEAKGEFIARMDADDVSLPTRLAMQVALMEKDNLDACGCHFQKIDAKGNLGSVVHMPLTSSSILVTMACTVPFAHGSVLLRRSFLEKHNLKYSAGVPVEDYYLWCQMIQSGARFGNVDAVLFSYRHLPYALSKVHARANRQAMYSLRRAFVLSQSLALVIATDRVLENPGEMPEPQFGYTLLAAHLLSAKTDSAHRWQVFAKTSPLVSLRVAVKLLRGF
jgi:glycosyltransferase involved in cell wall biosynthesis